MIAITVALVVVLALAAGIVGLVLVGIEGRGHQRLPRLAERLTTAARHLNGEGKPPRALTRLLS